MKTPAKPLRISPASLSPLNHSSVLFAYNYPSKSTLAKALETRSHYSFHLFSVSVPKRIVASKSPPSDLTTPELSASRGLDVAHWLSARPLKMAVVEQDLETRKRGMWYED